LASDSTWPFPKQKEDVMQSYEMTEAETGDELEMESFEFESGEDPNGEVESTLSEVEEMELASELLAVSSEAELDQFLGKLFKGAWKGIRKVGRVVGRVAGPLGGVLKGVAKKALPFVGGALGSFIPIPGVGTALGTAIGGAASNLLEVDLEGVSPEDQEFELARRFVRLANSAAAYAANQPAGINPNSAALAAVRNAANQLGNPQGSGRQRKRSGRWIRRGDQIVLLGV
jgi:uncharacterized protein (DUF697 family)